MRSSSRLHDADMPAAAAVPGRTSAAQQTAAAPATPAAVAPRDVFAQALADVCAAACFALPDRVAAHRGRLVARADSPAYQAALVRAMDAPAWQAIRRDPQGLDGDRLQRDAAAIGDAELAAATYDPDWMLNNSQVWLETYVRSYIAKHGAADLAAKLFGIGPVGVAYAGFAIGQAERDGLIATRDALIVGNPLKSPFGQPDPSLESAITTSLDHGVGDARARFDQAQQALKDLDSKLQLELREIGPALYDPNEHDPALLAAARQRVETYIAQFHQLPEYVAAKREADAAAAALGAEIGNVGDEILAHGNVTGAADNSAAQRTLVLDTYQALAGAEATAFAAVQWAEQHRADARFAPDERLRVAQVSQLGQDTDGCAKLQTIQQLMQAAHDAASDDARARGVEQVVAFIETAICVPYDPIATIRGMTELRQQLRELVADSQISVALRAGNEAKATVLAKQFFAGLARTQQPATIVRRIWSGFGALLGAFGSVQELAGAENPLALGLAAKDLYDNLMSLKELASKAETADVDQQASDLVKQLGGHVGRLGDLGLGILDIAGSALDLQTDLQRAQSYDSNFALKIQVAADIASLVGSALCLIPPLAPLGAMIETCASFVSLIDGFFVGDPEGDARRAEERAQLATPGVLGDAQLAAELTQPCAADNLAAAQQAGMTVAQIHQLARARRGLFGMYDVMQLFHDLLAFLAAHREIGNFTCRPSLYDALSTLSDDDLYLIYDDAFLRRDVIASNQEFDTQFTIAREVARALPGFYVYDPR